MSEQRVAIVTGAAGGIGEATVAELTSRGYRVSAWDINQSGLDRLPEPVDRRCIDLGDFSSLEPAAQQVVQRFGRIDLLVNNAIFRDLVPMSQISRQSWEKTLSIGLTAPAFLSRFVAEAMRSTGGVIVNISSIMSGRAGGISPAYVAAKGGLDALTYELAVTYASWNIRVVGIRPGAIDTELSRDYDPAGQPREDESANELLRRWSQDHIPLGKWGRPEEIARAIAWVASDEASYLTGTLLDVDGGWSHAHFPASLRGRVLGK